MKKSVLSLLSVVWAAASLAAHDAPEAEWKRALAKLEARVAQLSALVETQGGVIERT